MDNNFLTLILLLIKEFLTPCFNKCLKRPGDVLCIGREILDHYFNSGSNNKIFSTSRRL